MAMAPPVWEILSITPSVQSLVGSAIYPGGQVAEGTPLPYITWQGIGGSPENCLGHTPDVDMFSIQFDCWADDVAEVRAIAEAVRDAIEQDAHIVSWRGDQRDDATGAYRYSFDVDWYVYR